MGIASLATMAGITGTVAFTAPASCAHAKHSVAGGVRRYGALVRDLAHRVAQVVQRRNLLADEQGQGEGEGRSEATQEFHADINARSEPEAYTVRRGADSAVPRILRAIEHDRSGAPRAQVVDYPEGPTRTRWICDQSPLCTAPRSAD